MHPTLRLLPACLGALLSGALLAGCATAEQTQRFNDGWKPGHVKAVGTAAALGEQHPRLDCRPTTDADAANTVYAVVSYPQGHRHPSVIASVPEQLHPGLGETVWVNSQRCVPLEPRAAGD